MSTTIKASDWIDSLDSNSSPSDSSKVITKETSEAVKSTTKNNLTTGKLEYKGTWNATTNIPALSDSGGGGVKGDYYVVSVAGSTSVDSETDWKVGDWIINNGATWDKIDNTDETTDPNAIHDNIASEISAITEKTTLVDDDLFLIEDSEDSNNKKKVKKSNLGASGGASFASGIIKASTSVVNDSSLSSISDWSGSAGEYYSDITLNTAKDYDYVNNIAFYEMGTTYRKQIIPMGVEPRSTTVIRIYMPTDDDLYIGAL